MDDLPTACATLRAQWPAARMWLGGHSLGGQLGSLYASQHPNEFAGLVLVASGSPYWRQFPRRWLIGAAYVLAPLLAKLVGHLPGRRIGFGGNEARGVIADWARSGRAGRYAATGVDRDFEHDLGKLQLPILALRLRDDWLGPQASLNWLLGKMPRSPCNAQVIAPDDLGGANADHFSWMKKPETIAARIVDWLGR
jgi:predicted alpha/beta hydrolase